MTKIVTIAGAAVIEGRRLALVRKRGQAFYILAGGKLEAHETPEQAVVREVDEELGVRFLPDGTHTVWEDDAGGDPGVRVRVHLYNGAFVGKPVCQAEIMEIAMVDLVTPAVAVAPSLARQIMPWLASLLHADMTAIDHGFHKAVPIDADGTPYGDPVNAIYDGSWTIAEPGKPDHVGALPGLDFVLLDDAEPTGAIPSSVITRCS